MTSHLASGTGTEELAHLEIVGAMLYQLTRNLSMDEIKKSGFDTYFADHTTGVYTQAASGAPFNAFCFASKGDVFTDIHEDLAAEQKARTTYDNLIRLADDYDVREPLKFLRAREVVHYQRFSEALAIAQDSFDNKSNFYAYNPAFDKPSGMRMQTRTGYQPRRERNISQNNGCNLCRDNSDTHHDK